MNSLRALPYAAEITAAATRHHLDPRLLAAVASQESGGPGSEQPRNIVGDGGHGHGLFQIDDRWHTFAATPAAMDPAKNADYAAGMIAGNLKRFGGNVHAALSAYNAGSPSATGTVTDWGDKRLGYADSVLRHMQRLGAPTTLASGSAREVASASSRDAQIADSTVAAAASNALQSLAGSIMGGGSPAAYPPQTHHQPSSEAALKTAMSGYSDQPDDA